MARDELEGCLEGGSIAGGGVKPEVGRAHALNLEICMKASCDYSRPRPPPQDARLSQLMSAA